MSVHGLDKVLKNLNKSRERMQKNTMRGLVKSAAHVRSEMDKKEPKIPVDTGNLRASYFTNTFLTPKGDPVVTMGFGANYAWFVHEMVDATFKRPEAGPKFLETHIKRNQGKILEIVAKEAKE